MSGYQFVPSTNQFAPMVNQFAPITDPSVAKAQFAGLNLCNPCGNDPLYNVPPCPPCPPCKKGCKCKKCCTAPCGSVSTCIGPPVAFGPRFAVTTWKINYLVSNKLNFAAHLDVDLVNPWGIVVHNGQLWVVNGTTDSITNYDLFGNKILSTIYVRDAAHNSAFPTGIAINCGGGFPISNGVTTRSAVFLTATEHGTVHVYNPVVDTLNSYLVLNNQLTGEVAVYTGLAVANGTLYLADFFNGHIDTFDSNYGRLLGYYFIDGDTSDPIPLNYGPFNIVQIGCYLYVLYARRDDINTLHDLDGPGHGFISVFNLDGSFVRRFTSRGVLNSPWAMIPAPCEVGFPPGSFLVGNNGDGRINIFDCNGRYVGPVLAQTGLPIMLPGLWGLAPYYTDSSEIFFASAPDENQDGIVGSLTRDSVIQF